MARLLVEHGADVNQLPPTGIYGSALIAACFKFDPSPAIVEFLIENGAEVNAIPKVGRWGSALAAAVRTDILNTSRILEIDMLIKYGADVNLPLPTGLYGSALISAASTDFASCRYLVEKGADVHLHIPHGCYGSPLIAAMQSHSMKLVRFLLDRGVEVDQIPDGEEVVFGTALIAGAYWGFASGVQILLDAGAQVNLRTEVGRFGSALAAARADLTDEGGVFEHTPWYEEEERDEWKPEVEELLLKYGATE
jgi:ankyrin repeat protein